MVGDQVVRQLVAKNHPPIDEGIRAMPLQHARRVKLVEIQVVAEYTPLAIERDCLAGRVVKDADSIGTNGEYVGAVYEDRCKRVYP
jgi:hypothetical protein